MSVPAKSTSGSEYHVELPGIGAYPQDFVSIVKKNFISRGLYAIPAWNIFLSANQDENGKSLSR